MKLEEILTPTWAGLTTCNLGGITHYLGVEVVQMLGLSNITLAINRKSSKPKVSRCNWTMRMMPKINKGRAVYLLTYDGIAEMIRNNNNLTCNSLKRRLDE